ncbi:MAG TPA: glutaredoxin 3 [Steroidobacteraceae bacterium]
MSAPTIVMYSSAWCPYCARARDLLQGKGAAFQDIDVDEQPAQRAEMIRRSGRHTVPQIFIGERHIGGSDELQELEAAGGLDALLRPGSDSGPSKT